jgi:hypothetical protein
LAYLAFAKGALPRRTEAISAHACQISPKEFGQIIPKVSTHKLRVFYTDTAAHHLFTARNTPLPQISTVSAKSSLASRLSRHAAPKMDKKLINTYTSHLLCRRSSQLRMNPDANGAEFSIAEPMSKFRNVLTSAPEMCLLGFKIRNLVRSPDEHFIACPNQAVLQLYR